MEQHEVRDENGKLIFKLDHTVLLNIAEKLEKKWQGNKLIMTSDQVLDTNLGRLYLWEGYTIKVSVR
jgi:hypothetical protein